jgi:pimeloyl-ACP methyl ester carboxylesterase
MATITDHEAQQIDSANETGRTPVVFIHGLWLLPSSWDRWAQAFEEAGYAALTPSWPDDPPTVEEARRNPEVFAKKTVGQVADHVLPLPISSLRSAMPVLGNPANRGRAVALTLDQFKYGWANALSDEEATQLHETYHVPAPGAPLFQAATANLNPWTEAKVNSKSPDRGPLLIISGEKDHTVPWAIANASFKKQRRNEGVTEINEVPNRGHALTIDSGWREVADTALAFVKRFI